MTHLLPADATDSQTPTVAIAIALIAALAALVTAVVAYLGNRHTAGVAREANNNSRRAQDATATMDRREEWWDRAQWAMERACDKRSLRSREIGAHVLTGLSQSHLAHHEEKQMILDVLVVIATTDAMKTTP